MNEKNKKNILISAVGLQSGSLLLLDIRNILPSPSPATIMNVQVGDRVVAKGRSRTSYRATVRYVGCLPNLEHKGEFIGLELSAPHGTSDGKGCFQTKPKHALFVKAAQITEIIQSKAQTSKYTGSAATSHLANDQYMDDFEEGFEQLRVANEGKFQRGKPSYGSKTSDSSTSSSTSLTTSSSNGLQCGVGWESKIQNKTSSAAPRSSWTTGPVDPRGLLFDASDRNVLCQSLYDNKCVVGSADHGLKEFDATTGKQIRELYNKTNGHSEWVTCVKHLPDGRVISGGMDNKLCLWGRSGSRCLDLSGHSSSVSSVAVNDTGTHVISASYDKTIKVWNTKRGTEVTTLRGHTAPVLDIEWCTEGNGLVLSGDRSGMACIWDLEGGNASQLKGHRGHVTALKWLDAQTCVTGDQAGTIRLWDARDTRHPVQEFQAHPGGAVNDFALSTDALISTGADTKIQVLDIRSSMTSRVTWESHRDFIYTIDTLGDFVITGSGDGLMLFHNARTSKLMYGLGANQGAVRCIDATPGYVVASGDDGNAMVFEF